MRPAARTQTDVFFLAGPLLELKPVDEREPPAMRRSRVDPEQTASALLPEGISAYLPKRKPPGVAHLHAYNQ